MASEGNLVHELNLAGNSLQPHIPLLQVYILDKCYVYVFVFAQTRLKMLILEPSPVSLVESSRSTGLLQPQNLGQALSLLSVKTLGEPRAQKPLVDEG